MVDSVNKFTFCISAFLVVMFAAQHLMKPAPRPITVPVIYKTVLDANGNGDRYAQVDNACR
jgi:hypothetical protein